MNREIIVPISINKKTKSGISAGINEVVGAYVRDDFTKYLKQQLIYKNVIAINKEKAEEFLHSKGADCPKHEEIISYYDSTTYTLANVNYPSEKIPDRKLQL